MLLPTMLTPSPKHRNSRKLLLLATTILLAACNKGQVYDYSADVHSSGWTPADTLYFSIHVEEHATPRYPIDPQRTYQLSLAVRFASCYPAPQLRLHFSLLDQNYLVPLPLEDAEGMPDITWASNNVKEFAITECAFLFPDSGNYLLKVWPDAEVENILSLTATLE